MKFRFSIVTSILTAGGVLLGLTGCGQKPEAEEGPPIVRFQTDWYPQPEHGGYYQAVAEGLFEAEGIKVEIFPGGPGSLGPQKVATGKAELAMGRSDDVMLAVQEGLPIVIVCALMQHDPQALLLHESNPVNSLADLDGKSVMSTPGTAWALNVEKRYNLEMSIIPMNYGLAQFMSDPNFIQQCFITNEPYFVRQNGGKPKTLLLAQPGYDPYRVIFTSKKYAREHPDRIRAFVAASIKGWDHFIYGDATAAKAMIASRNEAMNEEFMTFSIDTMRENRLVDGDPDQNERIGLLQRDRLTEMGESLVDLGVLREPLALEAYVSFEFLPPELQAMVDL